MAERERLVVIGGGVIGCAVLYELARRGVPGLLLEAEPDLCEGTSKANSGIIHTGFDSRAGTIESRLLRRAAARWPELLDELGVPHLAVGALMLATTAADADRLRGEIAPAAAALGVRTELLDAAAVRAAAPYLSPDVRAALSIPDEAVVDPFWLTRAFAEAAVAGGARVRLAAKVVGLAVDDRAVRVTTADGGVLLADQVVDAAGLWADEVAALAGDGSFRITPRKGQFLVSEETFGVDRIVLPIPGPMGKGMLVTPIVFGGLLLGPTAVDQADKLDRSTEPAETARILAACSAMVPAMADARPVRSFAGLRTVSSTGDFILRPSSAGDRLYLAAGIRSTGISTSPAVAEAVADEIVARRGWAAPPARRTLAPPPFELPERPGPIVCLCRSIGRGEIEAACRRPTAPRTLDAIKRRGGATLGDCQGNLCALDVAAIVARERGIPLVAVERNRVGSWLWREGPGRAAASPGAPVERPAAGVGSRRRWDLAVIGAGRAGTAAAGAAAAAGLAVVIVERVERSDPSGAVVPDEPAGLAGSRAELRLGATAIGLAQDAGGWLVLGQTGEGGLELRARGVLLATGAYVEPGEHRLIAGPRTAGVMTGDLCRRVLAAGLTVGGRAALVGTHRRTERLAAALDAAGTRVTRLAEPPDAVRGEPHLRAVRAAGRWIACDALVLDDRVLPQAFLLRGLGLVDGRPGSPAPAAADGRLPLEGLWAAGCCVTPDADHDGCAERGRRAGAAAAAALGRGAAAGADR